VELREFYTSGKARCNWKRCDRLAQAYREAAPTPLLGVNTIYTPLLNKCTPHDIDHRPAFNSIAIVYQ
jgi:hypothetical protein